MSRLPNTDLIKVCLPPMDNKFDFQEESLALNLSTIMFQLDLRRIFLPIGRPSEEVQIDDQEPGDGNSDPGIAKYLAHVYFRTRHANEKAFTSVLMPQVVKSRDEIFSRWGYCDNHDLSRLDNQSIERDRLIGIGFVLDFVEFISFTFGDKEMISVIEAVSR
ncbi:hypothetical protein Tco_0269016 [Tanacetum coccineum]